MRGEFLHLFRNPFRKYSLLFPSTVLPLEITNAGEVLSFKLGFLINAGR